MTTVYVAAQQARLLGELQDAIEAIRRQDAGTVTAPIYGKDERGRDCTIIFTDEDMQRPEVKDDLIVDVQA